MLAGAGAAYGQQSASSAIVGQVLHATQGGRPGVTITATNLGTRATRVVVTDAEGRFSIRSSNAATYSLTVALSGFQTTTIKELVLRGGEVARPNLTLGLRDGRRERHRRVAEGAAHPDVERVGRPGWIDEKMLEKMCQSAAGRS